MAAVTSRDGTEIGYDKTGRGPSIILVAGALTARRFWPGPELAQRLSSLFTVYNYDRRGRGESGDTQPYAVEREIEDIEALVNETGTPALLFGHSSGGALALEAAVSLGGKIKKVAVYEVPYHGDQKIQAAWKRYIERLTEHLAAGRRAEAVALFMSYLGIPAGQVEGMRGSSAWPRLEALAPTLAYDHIALLGETAAIPEARLKTLTMPVLVMYGGAGAPFMRDTAEALIRILPHAQLCRLEGQTHELSAEVLAPVMSDYFGLGDG